MILVIAESQYENIINSLQYMKNQNLFSYTQIIGLNNIVKDANSYRSSIKRLDMKYIIVDCSAVKSFEVLAQINEMRNETTKLIVINNKNFQIHDFLVKDIYYYVNFNVETFMSDLLHELTINRSKKDLIAQFTAQIKKEEKEIIIINPNCMRMKFFRKLIEKREIFIEDMLETKFDMVKAIVVEDYTIFCYGPERMATVCNELEIDYMYFGTKKSKNENYVMVDKAMFNKLKVKKVVKELVRDLKEINRFHE